jgi:hypothetical protein
MRARSIVVVLFAVALVVPPSPSHAQGGGGRYYAETGHTLGAAFLLFFDALGGPEILGYPITDSFVDPLSGWLIQYTENARMELVPSRDQDEVRPRLSSLGEALGGWEPPLEDPGGALTAGMGGCRFYTESHHNVCHAFLEFYEAHGGPTTFGYPISEFTLEAGRIVQYFQAFRLDWYPDDPGGGRVRIAPLGRTHFERLAYDPELLRPANPGASAHLVRELRAQASLQDAVAESSGSQTVYVVARDQTLHPVARAAVLLAARFPNGERTLVMPLTDENGVSRITLQFENVPPGSVVDLEFWVVYGELQAVARDSFRVWW